MLKSDRMLALDIGASKVVLAEFTRTKEGVPELLNYGIGRLGIEPDKETDPSAYIVATIRDLMREHGIKPARAYMSVSGQAVFPRYVKLPPVARDKIQQIVQYEAEQNVPFPIEEVVWDYELISTGEEGETNAMLVAVKIENITRLTDCVIAAGLEPEVVDVAPLALYNAVRFNYPDLAGCTMVLDVGARSSNLVFIEQNRIFSRSMPVAGNTITQELMKEFDLSFSDAEDLKLEHAFVAFGGVYAGPDNEVADRVSKIVRNVITRMHAEVNRSVNFYRSQQGGNPPDRVLLAGGSSIIPHTDTFFREKLKVEIEYLNPFVNVPVGPNLDADRVGQDVHVLGEVVGLGLRQALQCPVEINLMPPNLVAKKAMRKRQPFFALAALGVAMTMLCWWFYTFRMSEIRDEQVRKVEERIESLRAVHGRLRKVLAEKKEAQQKVEVLREVVARRTRWIEIVSAIREAMLDGMWLTAIEPVVTEGGEQMAEFIEITGHGFNDKLRAYEEAGGPNAVEMFTTRLEQAAPFSEKTEIWRYPPYSPDAYDREFTIRIGLKQPMRLR